MAAAQQPQASNPEIDALLELERRQMAGDASITPEIGAKLKTKLDSYRAQGLIKPLKTGGAGNAVDDNIEKAANNIGIANSARDSVGFGTTGISGAIMSHVPGTAAVDLRGKIDSLKANLAFSELQKMRDNSPTGGALGQVSEGEERLLSSTVASLDPNQSDEELTANFNKIGDHYARWLKSLGYPEDQVANAMKGVLPPSPRDTAPGAPVDPNAGKDHLSLLQAPGAALETATGVRGGHLTVDVDNAARSQSPEFRAGLEKLLSSNAPKQQILDYWDKNAPGELEKLNGNSDAESLAARADADVKNQGGGAIGTAIRGAADTVTLGAAPYIGAGIRTLTSDKPTTFGKELEFTQAVQDADQRAHPYAYPLGQLSGAFLLPTGIEGAGARASEGALAAGKTADEAKIAARYGIAKRMAMEGGGIGAAYGFNSDRGGLGSKTVSAIEAGAGGAALGYGLGRLGILAGARADRRPPPDVPGGPIPPNDGPLPVGGADMRDVAGRLGVTSAPATIGGGVASAAQRALGNLPGAAGPVRRGVEAETAGLTDAARRAAEAMGPVSTPQQAGDIISRGARVADRTQARAAGRQYGARTEMMGGEQAPVTMGGTQAALANIRNDFSSNDVVGELLTHPLAKKLAGADAGELTLGESTELLSEARRVLRRARETKQAGRLIGQLSDIKNAIEGDVLRAAQASDAIAGRTPEAGAVAAQREGDKIYSDRMQAQKQELKKSLASFSDDVNSSGESVYRQMFTDMREEGGNLVRLQRTMRRLPVRAQKAFAASAFDDMGKAVDSAQNAAGDVWSPQTFLTNWAKASDDAKRVVFGGRGVDREISDIARYAERLRAIDKSRNFSNTAPNLISTGALGSALSAAVLGHPVALAAAGGAYAAANVLGRAFMQEPALRSWLANSMRAAVRGNDNQLSTLVKRLPDLAAKHPDVRGQIVRLENYLLNAANDNAGMRGRAAASDEAGQNQQERR